MLARYRIVACRGAERVRCIPAVLPDIAVAVQTPDQRLRFGEGEAHFAANLVYGKAVGRRADHLQGAEVLLPGHAEERYAFS